MEEQIIIKRGNNGVILEIYEDDLDSDTPKICKRVLVFEEKGITDNYDHILDAINEINDFLGVSINRRNRRNIVLGYERGWDYEGKEDIIKDTDYPELINKEDIED